MTAENYDGCEISKDVGGPQSTPALPVSVFPPYTPRVAGRHGFAVYVTFLSLRRAGTETQEEGGAHAANGVGRPGCQSERRCRCGGPSLQREPRQVAGLSRSRRKDGDRN